MVDKTDMQSGKLGLRLGRSISEKRKLIGLTQANVAEKMELDTETISRFERGVSLPSLLTLQKLSTVLNTTTSELLAESSSIPSVQAEVVATWLSNLHEKDRLFVMQLIKQSCQHFGLVD